MHKCTKLIYYYDNLRIRLKIYDILQNGYLNFMASLASFPFSELRISVICNNYTE